MDNKGWIKDYRKEMDSDIWAMPPLYLKVWQYLKYKMNHKERYIPLRDGTKELIKKGEHLTSYEAIAKGVSYYEGKVHRVPNEKMIKSILDWLEKNDMITTKRRRGKNGFTKVKLVNYEVYQSENSDEVSFRNLLGNFNESFENVSGTLKESSNTFIRGINKNDKERYKNDIRMKENEKEASQPTSPRFYPSPIHELLANTNSLTQVSYKTFFENADIREEDGVIKIKAENEFSKGAIQKYIPTLEIETNKKIEVI